MSAAAADLKRIVLELGGKVKPEDSTRVVLEPRVLHLRPLQAFVSPLHPSTLNPQPVLRI
jgi:hypothetical protein